ncbi:MAG TPA: hybrid sensor histidine kinase/response regulator [Nitrospirae bacterium]|nr:alkaline phosphatase synthesis transcriptional regulatory protein PhoP [bacterium BMS3Abin06]HDH11214.1 hybrid sensor histidine kinase/response regulator [Nitrospirota bacterium]HDZ02455.1 hybrid sensor histidine kinase/response regulator [Nitrospirota bacterium]
MNTHNDSNIQTKPIVLVVDDSQSILTYVKGLLEEAGFRVFTASDGRMGLECIESHKPDIVLLDIEMPVMNGLEVLDKLGKPGRLFSIILLTSLSDIKNRIEGLDKGADDYITKPFDERELIARVSAAVRTTSLKRELESAKCIAEDALSKFRKAQSKVIEEQKINAIARLASGMAHEINNPLGFIQSNIGTLKNYSGILSEGASRFMEISAGGCNAEKVIKETLPWIKNSKLEFICRDIEPLISETLNGVTRISSILRCLLIMDQAVFYTETEVMDLNSIARIFDSPSCPELPQGVSIVTDLTDSPLMVTGKSDQLRIAIENIFKNAIHAVGEQGEIRVTTRLENNLACMEIRDSGEGIPEEIMPIVFEPFFTTGKSHETIGLGLTISQYFVQAHGGRITVESGAGAGTCVKILVPGNNEAGAGTEAQSIKGTK